MPSRPSGRYVLATAALLVLGIPAVGLAAGEGRSILGGKRNPSGGQELTRETQVIVRNGSYGTRQSNLRDGDAAARSTAAAPTRAASRASAPTTSRAGARSSSRPAAGKPAASWSATRRARRS